MTSSRTVQVDSFRKIRRRLLLSNLFVFSLVLGGFAIAIRLSFLYNLRQQYQAQVSALARSGVAVVEFEDGQIEIESYEFPTQSVNPALQGVQWFQQNQLIDQRGDVHPTASLNAQPGFYRYPAPIPIQSYTLPVTHEGKIVAHIRASQSLQPFYDTLRQFDMGLGLGAVVALGISGLGGLWLNRQTMRPIENSYHRLRQFTADASHELRNPLMAISSNAELALKYSEGMREDDKETLDIIVSATEQMTDLTHDLLLLSRFDRQIEMEKRAVDLTRLLENLVRLYQSQAESSSINLSADIQPDLSLSGNAQTLIRAFTNLIQNSLRYTLSAGKVVVRGWQEGNRLFVTVEDTGVGIDAAHLDKIFDRFWRADKARTQAASGSGLGLSITQAIVHNHGGTITVTSQLDYGSCFTIQLPATAA
ncbi:MAG: sensor histidine kinase [Phormidesmis sp.]